MDDEKSIAEKLTDAITKATDSVKTTMSNIVDTASQAAQYAMENNAERMSGQTAAELVPGQIAATGNEHVYLPQVTDAAAMPAPLVAVQRVPKKRTARTKLSSGKRPPANKPVAKKVANKPAPMKSKKKSKKKSNKAAKKSANKRIGKKTAKRTAKKSAKKAGSKRAGKKTKSKTNSKSKR
jgi:hypothetical protein